MSRGATKSGRGGLLRLLSRLLSSFLLLGTGFAVGVIIGTAWPVPRVLRDWLMGPVETLIVAPDPDDRMEAGRLEAFRELQSVEKSERTATSPPMPTVAAPHPRSAERPRSSRPGGNAARVIAGIARRAESGDTTPVVTKPLGSGSTGTPRPDAAPPARTHTGEVVQVASYLDRRSADALARRLVRDGLDAYVADGRPGGETRFRVRVQPERGQAAVRLAKVLQGRGFNIWVTQE